MNQISVKSPRRHKAVAFLLVFVMLLNTSVTPLASVGSDVVNGLETLLSNVSDALTPKPPTSLEDITIPTVDSNPNTPSDVTWIPVYNTEMYEDAQYSYRFLAGYGTLWDRTPQRSQYYTGSILTLTSYYKARIRAGDRVDGSLPYTEMRNQLFHPDLTLLSDASYSSAQLSAKLTQEDLDKMLPEGATLWDYLDPTQTQMAVSAKLLAGYGSVSAYMYNTVQTGNNQTSVKWTHYDDSYDVATGKFSPLPAGEHYYTEVLAPFGENFTEATMWFTTTYNGILTDMSAALMDEQAPYVQNLNFRMEKGLRGDEADLILELTFNEGMRPLSCEDLTDLYNNTYVVVNLYNESTKKTQQVRLYLETLDGGKTVTFRGNIGRLHYCDFYVSGISDVKVATDQHFYPAMGAIDLVDRMALGNGAVITYGNKTHVVSGVYYEWNNVNLVSDHAGNSWDTRALRYWSGKDLKRFRFVSNTFEAVEVHLYNEKTLSVALGESDGKNLSEMDYFVGPGHKLTAHVLLSRELPAEAIEGVYVTLNILDQNGQPLKAYPTSSTLNEENPLYGAKTKGTLLRFEDIPLTAGMTLDVAEGEVPRIRITGMGTDYNPEEAGLPQAYPYVTDPYNDLYGDLTAPTAEIQKVADGQVTLNGKTYYQLSFRIGIADVANYAKISTVDGRTATLFLGAGVEQDTTVYYQIDNNATPLGAITSETPRTLLSSSEGNLLSLGSYTTMLNSDGDSVKYLHMLVEGGSLYVNGLTVGVTAYDAANNYLDATVTESETPPAGFEYIIDEISPVVGFVSQKTEAINGNTSIKLTMQVKAQDHSRIDQVLYCFYNGKLPEEGDGTGDDAIIVNPDASLGTDTSQRVEWQPAVIEDQQNQGTVTVTIQKDYRGEENASYQEILWVKVIDTYGNEGEPVGNYIRLNLSKPATNVVYDGDPNAVSNQHQILVSAPSVPEGVTDTAITRVTLTPKDNSGYAYVTLVQTGQTNVDVLALAGLEWYRVAIDRNVYTEVSEPVTVDDHDGILDGLLNHYGEMKISFENGYAGNGDMIPVTDVSLSAAAAAGSYFSDPNYYTVRYASPFLKNLAVHAVDFGEIQDHALPFNAPEELVDIDGTVVVPDADFGAAPYVFNQTYKGVNPMRNAQFHFTISNVANSSYGLLDFDYAASYAELLKVSTVENEEDTVVVTDEGLWATGSQYFTLPALMDNGEEFTTGAYYLRVTILSYSGHKTVFESSRVVLDAQMADNAGMWEYSYKTGGLLDESLLEDEEEYGVIQKTAADSAFSDIGIVVITDGETQRNRYFATYSFGAKNLKVTLRVPDSEREIEGVTVGEVAGFKMWNVLSNPTAAEIQAKSFELTPEHGGYGAALTDTLVRESNLTAIYTEDTIPQGINGFGRLFLVKGTNTFCYQVKMKNGYVSPIRQFTVTVTDEAPALTLAVDSYQPSLNLRQDYAETRIVNADHVRYRIDTAYSLNGSGKVNVELWSKYDMNVGQSGTESLCTLPEPLHIKLQPIADGLQVEDYVDLEQNSYTADFPSVTNECTAVLVATDEYGGVTIVAPQLGDLNRLDSYLDPDGRPEICIIYGHSNHFDDPYDPANNPFQYRMRYNEPQYYGARILSLDSYLEENTPDGYVRVRDLQTFDASLQYNYFNIDVNDVSLAAGSGNRYEGGGFTYVSCQGLLNIDYILLSGATVTLSGGHIESPVTVDLRTGKLITENGEISDEYNTVGYMNGQRTEDSLDRQFISICFAHPQADATHAAGTTTTVSYTLSYGNAYGDTYTLTGTVELPYEEYEISEVEMTESGAKLNFSFPYRDDTNAGLDRTGIFQNGNGEVTVTDYYGNEVTLGYAVTGQKDEHTEIRYEKYTHTGQPVTVTLKGLYNITVDVTDYEIMSVTGNGSTEVTVTLTKNTRFSYRYLDGNEDECTFFITVDNIFDLEPYVVYNVDLTNPDNYNVTEGGIKYRYGNVTAYLVDPNYAITDLYTGAIPTFTFTPGGDNYYVFDKDEIRATLGDEIRTLEEDVIAYLGLVLYEAPALELEVQEDKETPNVQIQAYSKLGEAYTNSKLTLKLTALRNSTVLTDHYGYTSFDYVGNRANLSEVLERLGWSTAYRFVIETVDSSRVRLFVKEGLYADAPTFENGVSDTIEGVELNSKLLTVTENAQFTLFVVDCFNNYSSIAFDVQNIGDAPAPEVVKIPMSHGLVRVYLIPSESVGEENFRILDQHNPLTDTDTQSAYLGHEYVEIRANDDYEILYWMKYEGTEVWGRRCTSISEISVDEITMKELSWSANKLAEATPGEITVDIRFSHEVAEIRAVTGFDASVVTFSRAGNTIRVTYADNHDSLTFAAEAANGTLVTVTLDAVTNIDHSAPEITLVDETLSPDGRSMTLVLATNERTSYREGNGRWGDEVVENGVTYYYYTLTLTENRTYTFTFADMSGIQTTFTYECTELVLDGLKAYYNTAPSAEGAVTDPSLLALEVGDLVYIQLNRAAEAILSAVTETLTIPAGEWYELTIPEGVAGIPPYIIYTDDYGNTLTDQFAKLDIPDSTPPEIYLSRKTYAVREGTDRATIEAELMANCLVYDADDPNVTLTVSFTEHTNAIGLTDVTYTAVDSAGNESTVYGKLRITSIYEPIVFIDDARVLREEGISTLAGEELILNIQTGGVAYKVVVASGKRTAAQMKTYEAVIDYSTDESLNLGVMSSGYYTILIVTEQRDYFRIFVVIEDF